MFAAAVHAQIPVYPGTNLRGRVDDAMNQPLPGARVDLFFFNANMNAWMPYSTAYTSNMQGMWGMYFFNGVPPGRYGLQVNGTTNYLIDVVPIDYRFAQFQDLLPIK